MERGGASGLLRIADYSCVQAFLDDLYIHYLRDRFAPFTYGISWCLEEVDIFDDIHLFLLPWSWLIAPQAGVAADTAWLQQTPLRDCGVRPQTSWRVRTDTSSAPTGLALNDERIFTALKHSPKVESFLRRQGVLKDCPISQVESPYHFRHVVYRRGFFGGAPPPGTAIVQTTKPLAEIPGLEYWLFL